LENNVEPERMRLKSVFINPQLHGQVRVHAAETGVTITDVVTRALKAWLEQKPKKNGRK